jgi:hypothetical protein
MADISTKSPKDVLENDLVIIQFPINRQCPGVKKGAPPIVDMDHGEEKANDKENSPRIAPANSMHHLVELISKMANNIPAIERAFTDFIEDFHKNPNSMKGVLDWEKRSLDRDIETLTSLFQIYFLFKKSAMTGFIDDIRKYVAKLESVREA